MSTKHKDAVADIDPTSIGELDAAALHDLWRRLHRRPPPKALAGELLVRALAHHIQVARHGGLSSAAKFRLKHAIEDGEALQRASRSGRAVAGASAPVSRALRTGTRLLREWRGVMLEVVVVPDGYLWQEQVHRSLSSVAKAITGTAWNGWTFFGIKRQGISKTVEEDRGGRSPRDTAENVDAVHATGAARSFPSASSQVGADV